MRLVYYTLLGGLISMYSGSSHADPALWQDLQQRQAATASESTESITEQRLLHLDEVRLDLLVQQAALPELSLPLPQGGFTSVRLMPEAVFDATVSGDYPQFKTWRIESLDGKVQSGRAELTPLGLSAMLTLPNGDTLFIESTDVNQPADQRTYRSLSKKANASLFKRQFSCGTQAPLTTNTFAERPFTTAQRIAAKAGETLHTYRLAVAASGEYTRYYNGDKDKALAAIVKTINRINEIYSRDLAIQLRLVSTTNTIFADPDTDPYSSSAENSTLLLNNQYTLDSLVGSASYDVGHLFTIGFGGVAIVESVCTRLAKGQGLSSWNKPEGDIFALDFVAHELGHQFGGTHTFNSTLGSCAQSNRIAATAYEPGAGSSIMAYSGLCGTDNLQAHSDAMFHAGSIAQITNYAHNGYGASCANVSSLNNRNPIANAGSDAVIPAQTPFILTGTASDADNDSLTYAWDQMDAGAATRVNSDSGNNALIRSFLPTTSPTRTVPRFSDLVVGSQVQGDVLPSTNRTLNFRLQVRDGKGGIGHDDKKVTVIDTGQAFSIIAPTANTITAGSSIEVKWNVAKTNEAPINCSQVDITFNTDASESNFQPLLSATPNTGSATVTLPMTLGTINRIRVKCSDNIFFALSDAKVSSSTVVSTTTDDDEDGGGGSLPFNLLLMLLPLGMYRLLSHRNTRGKTR